MQKHTPFATSSPPAPGRNEAMASFLQAAPQKPTAHEQVPPTQSPAQLQSAMVVQLPAVDEIMALSSSAVGGVMVARRC